MKQKRRNFIAALTLACLCTGFAACEGDEPPPGATEEPETEDTKTDTGISPEEDDSTGVHVNPWDKNEQEWTTGN